MSLLYRLPLFNFDIDNPVTLEKHRETILEAIKLSSIDFFRELLQKPFSELDEKRRIKLRKYLLRGRYRPTPFGGFAGVGIAEWGKTVKHDPTVRQEILITQSNSQKDLTYDSIENHPKAEFQLSSGIHLRKGFIHVLNHDRETQRWTGHKIPGNSLIQAVINEAKDKPICFSDFVRILDPNRSGISEKEAVPIWNQIIDLGILFPIGKNKQTTNLRNTGVDIILKNKPVVPENVKQRLNHFINTAGKLFSKEESIYIKDFKHWFTGKYDDRYLSLHDLLANEEIFSGNFQTNNPYNQYTTMDFASILLSNTDRKYIDLENHFQKSALPPEIHDLQILFRLDSDLNPIIENIVCNRPFVYTGRFSRDQAIKEFTEDIKLSKYTCPNTIYASLEIFENDKINHICNASRAFSHEISPFPPASEFQLDFKDLYIGIFQNSIEVIHKPSGKAVVPVVLHPLNGDQISHPIMRLLWEIAHQDRFRFLPYQSKVTEESGYCPQLNWGNLCLQSRRWNLSGPGKTEGKNSGKKNYATEVPRYILAGTTDRELLLDRESADDLKILDQELQRTKKLTLSEPLWFLSEHFKSADGVYGYPQFVHQVSMPVPKLRAKEYFNPITHTESNCLCINLTCCCSEATETLETVFRRVNEDKTLSDVPNWFFVIYGKNGFTEIRLRFLKINKKTQENLLLRLSVILREENFLWNQVEYHPETFKYGEEHLDISHQIFHLESIYASGYPGGRPGINLSHRKRENIIVGLWKLLILESPCKLTFFTSLKDHVKQIPPDLLARYKSQFSYLDEKSHSPFPYTKYNKLLRSHRLFQNGDEKTIHFLHNHLHMMVNRFFPQGTADHERKIRYGLYRELGKHLYTLKQPENTPD